MVVTKTVKPFPTTSLDIEIAVARYFNYRQNLIVPNVSWGLDFDHEIDLLVMSANCYCTEVEIKTTAYDLRRDLLKSHGHRSSKLKRQYLAVPKKLVELAQSLEFFTGWGILSLGDSGWIVQERAAMVKKSAKPLDLNQVLHLHHLASMRVWTLKTTLADRINRSKLPSVE